MASYKPSVAIFGTSGNVGSATIKAIAEKFPTLDVRAGVRDTTADKSKALLPAAGSANITLVKANLAEPATLDAALQGGIETVFVIAPGTEDRGQLTINGIDAAKRAKTVKFLVVVSVATADKTDEIFGKQFGPVEAAAKATGIPTAILRLPLFIDNNWGHQSSIKSEGKFYGGSDPTAKFTDALVADIGLAAATILAQGPSKHAGKTYNIATSPHSFNDLADAFAKALGKKVEYVRIPYEGLKQAYLGYGMPEWQVDGIIELFKGIDAGKYTFASDFKTITGREPTTIDAWVSQVAQAFK